MRIREAAARTGRSRRDHPVLRKDRVPPRTGGGYRDYLPADISTLSFIKRARDLGFSISDISSLLNLWRDQDRSSAQVKRLTEEHVAQVEQRIAELQTIRKTLIDLAQGCHGDERPECPILEDFAGGGLK